MWIKSHMVIDYTKPDQSDVDNLRQIAAFFKDIQLDVWECSKKKKHISLILQFSLLVLRQFFCNVLWLFTSALLQCPLTGTCQFFCSVLWLFKSNFLQSSLTGLCQLFCNIFWLIYVSSSAMIFDWFASVLLQCPFTGLRQFFCNVL